MEEEDTVDDFNDDAIIYTTEYMNPMGMISLDTHDNISRNNCQRYSTDYAQ